MAEAARMKRRMLGMLHARRPELRLQEVGDPRGRRGQRWSLDPALSMLITAMCAGCKSLAQAEALSDEMSPEARRLVGITRRLPDTTLRSIVVRLEPADLNAVLHRETRAAHRRKALGPDVLPMGMVSIDGKATAIEVADEDFA